jgi:hypothetical protein
VVGDVVMLIEGRSVINWRDDLIVTAAFKGARALALP